MSVHVQNIKYRLIKLLHMHNGAVSVQMEVSCMYGAGNSIQIMQIISDNIIVMNEWIHIL